MEENMNLDHRRLQYGFIDFMGVGAQHDDDEMSPVEHELDPEQENMNLDSGSQYVFIDFMGVGAQHDDDIDDPQELDPAPENVNLDRGSCSFMDVVGLSLSAQYGDDIDIDDLIPQEPDPAPENINLDLGLTPYSFMDFMTSSSLSAQHGDDIDIDDLISQEPDPAQMHHHHHQRDSTCNDVNDARLEDRVYSPLELLPTGKVERNTPEDRTDRLDLDMRLLPESSMRLLRQEGPQFLTLQLGPTLDPALNPTSEPALVPTSDPALDLALDPVTLDPVTAEGWEAWVDIVHQVLSFILMRILISTIS